MARSQREQVDELAARDAEANRLRREAALIDAELALYAEEEVRAASPSLDPSHTLLCVTDAQRVSLSHLSLSLCLSVSLLPVCSMSLSPTPPHILLMLTDWRNALDGCRSDERCTRPDSVSSGTPCPVHLSLSFFGLILSSLSSPPTLTRLMSQVRAATAAATSSGAAAAVAADAGGTGEGSPAPRRPRGRPCSLSLSLSLHSSHPSPRLTLSRDARLTLPYFQHTHARGVTTRNFILSGFIDARPRFTPKPAETCENPQLGWHSGLCGGD